MRRRLFLLGGVAALSTAAAGYYFWPALQRPAVAVPPGMNDAEFQAVLKAVRPAAGEDLFAEIPWHTSLWDARQQAAREGKPILLWEMDGHPLGCG